MISTSRRGMAGAGIAAVLGAVLLPAALLPAAAQAATPTTTTIPAQAAAGWLVGQLAGTNHDHYQTIFGGIAYADDGNTADGVLAMDAAGVAQDAAARATSWLQTDAVNYATGSGSTAHYYPGSVAKLLLVAEAQHINGHAFGTLDLPKVLHDQETSAGLFTNPDDATYGPSTLAQALAIVALSHTGASADQADAKAISYLVAQKCSDGSFQFDLRPDPTVACKTADVDTTAFAIQGLLAGGADAAASLTWLIAQQHADGSFGTTQAVAGNANSTALAIEALVAGGRSTSAALGWLVKQQQGCATPVAQRGAVRFQGAFDATSALRATTQATQALAAKSLLTITNVGANGAAPTLFCASAIPVVTPVKTPPKTVVNGPVVSVAPVTVAGASLPLTGPAPIGGLSALGGGLLVAGVALLGAGRRRVRRS